MNFLFISPNFPDSYRHWCEALRNNGVNVLGIGDTPYDALSWELKEALAEYYWLPSLENYDDVYRAVAFLSFHHGKIDWIESNNEYWLSLDARLREDFNVTTGVHPALLAEWQSKAGMKPYYKAAGVPVARQIKMESLEDARAFIKEVGWPAFCKPEIGVGSGGAWKLENDADLERAFAEKGDTPYVLEEFVGGEICSYDCIVNSKGEILFENQEEFPPSMSDVAAQALDICYYSRPEVDPKLQKLGHAVIEPFGFKSRFLHMEFFRLTEAKKGLGDKGDYVGLEINCRPPGGYTPDLINYAHNTSVYQIWADMVCYDESHVPVSEDNQFCAHVSRRNCYEYEHSYERVLAVYGDHIRCCQNIPDALSDDLGNFAFEACFKTKAEMDEFAAYAQMRKKAEPAPASKANPKPAPEAPEQSKAKKKPTKAAKKTK